VIQNQCNLIHQLKSALKKIAGNFSPATKLYPYT
jgi:hypothetical protein